MDVPSYSIDVQLAAGGVVPDADRLLRVLRRLHGRGLRPGPGSVFDAELDALSRYPALCAAVLDLVVDQSWGQRATLYLDEWERDATPEIRG